MKAMTLFLMLTLLWIVTPNLSSADERGRHDRYVDKGRDHHVEQSYRDRDRGRHHDRDWRRHDRYDRHDRRDRKWTKHDRHRHVVYAPARVVTRPLNTRVIYREPVVVYPSSTVYVGVPNLSFRFSW